MTDRIEVTIAGDKYRFLLDKIQAHLGEFDTKSGYSSSPSVRASLKGWSANGKEYRGGLNIEASALSKMMEVLARELRTTYYFMLDNDLLDKFGEYKEAKERKRAEVMKANEPAVPR
jgi:hypothetical protein